MPCGNNDLLPANCRYLKHLHLGKLLSGLRLGNNELFTIKRIHVPAVIVAGFYVLFFDGVINKRIPIYAPDSTLCNGHPRILGVVDIAAVFLAECPPVDCGGLTHSVHLACRQAAASPQHP